jgi:hypothetical protein
MLTTFWLALDTATSSSWYCACSESTAACRCAASSAAFSRSASDASTWQRGVSREGTACNQQQALQPPVAPSERDALPLLASTRPFEIAARPLAHLGSREVNLNRSLPQSLPGLDGLGANRLGHIADKGSHLGQLHGGPAAQMRVGLMHERNAGPVRSSGCAGLPCRRSQRASAAWDGAKGAQRAGAPACRAPALTAGPGRRPRTTRPAPCQGRPPPASTLPPPQLRGCLPRPPSARPSAAPTAPPAPPP